MYSMIRSVSRVRSVLPLCKQLHLKANHSSYASAYQESIENPSKFWGKAAENIKWIKPFNKVYSDPTPGLNDGWFQGGLTNVCYNALDVNINEHKRGDQVALIWDSPVTNTVKTFTYSELFKLVTTFAGVLKQHGVGKGDRVVIYNPAIPQSVIAMLACARIGAVHSVVFGGFSSDELATRIDDAEPKVIISASCGIEGKKVIPYKPLLDHALELTKHKPHSCIIYQRPNLPEAPLTSGRDYDWDVVMAKATPHTDFTPVDSSHPLYILYTSGTTGKPKGVVRDTGGSMVSLKWSIKNIFGMNPGDTWWASSDLGWVVGHSYILYGPLLNGNTTILYEGKPVGTPDPGAFWRVISQHKVKALFTAPTAFRAIKKEDPSGSLLKNYDLSSFKTLFLAGERADPPTVIWLENLLKRPVIDNYWMTETGWPITANYAGLGLFPTRLGSGGKAVPGYQLSVLDNTGTEVPHGTDGNLCVKLPLPPGTLTTLYKANDRFHSSYLSKFPGYFQTGDAGHVDNDRYVFIMSRTDDVINVAGHRLSTGHIEEVIAGHKSIAECAVFGVQDDLKGQVPFGCVVMKDGVGISQEELKKEVIELVREHLGPVYSFKKVVVVKRLPKTRSGKILRGTMAKIVDGIEYKMPATIDDPVTLEEIKEAVKHVK